MDSRGSETKVAERRREFNTESFSAEVNAAIDAVLPSEDPLDAPHFDAVAFINAKFPDEHSLEGVGSYAQEVEARIAGLDRDIYQAIRDQAVSGRQASQGIADCKVAIRELFNKITDIKGKAQDSEKMVDEICRDIRQLDAAKKNLETSITALKRLQMLITSINRLKDMAADGRFELAADLMGAVTQLTVHFEDYTRTPRIKELLQNVSEIKMNLRDEVFHDFSSVGVLGFEESTDGAPPVNRLAADCKMVVAMGGNEYKALIRQFIKTQIRALQRKFPPRSTSLEDVARHFIHIKKVLREYETRQLDSVFPRAWRMKRRLVTACCEQTRDNIIAILDSDHDVKALVRALAQSMAFEKEMDKRFERDEADTCNDDEEAANSNGDAEGSDESNASLSTPFLKKVSCAFEPHLVSYVQAQKQNLDEMVDELTYEETIDHKSSSLDKYSSAVNLFMIIRDNLEHCAEISNGQTLMLLQKEVKQVFRKYADEVALKLPSSVPTDGLAEKDVRIACYVVNTAAYCAETVPKVGDIVTRLIQEPFKEHIDMEAESEYFYDMLSSGIKVLIEHIMARCGPAFGEMTRVAWANIQDVGDSSPYVSHIKTVLEAEVPLIRSILSALFFDNFCDRFASTFLPAFMNNIFKCKRIGPVGSQQLLLDTSVVKTVVLAIPDMGQSKHSAGRSKSMNAAFSRYVYNEVSKVEVLIQLVGMDAQRIEENFKVLWRDGSAEDLIGILQLKGLKKRQQQELVQKLGLAYRSVSTPSSAAATLRNTFGEAGQKTQKAFETAGDAFAKMFKGGNN
eukprot:INCI12364.1.p1 GENE.INCI12364.1~~INCI12364.1.p1  ORF type:complete len:796 (-),score=180.58 INCI12364.1:2409-4796(-)